MKRVILHSIFLLLSVITLAQDPQFSQVFAVPLYLGPSFAGSTGGTRVATNFRDQWPALKREYISYSLAFDHFFKQTNSCIGLAAFQDHSGAGLLTSTYCLLQYAHVISLSKKIQFRPGIEASFNNRSINYNKIVFGDQLSYDGILPTTVESSLDKKKSYFDFAASLLLFHEHYWLGVSAHHLALPNQSLTGDKSRVPLKLSLYGGKKIKLNTRMAKRQKENLYIAFDLRNQAKFNQCLIGSYFDYTEITIGLWYRGIPFKHTYQPYFNSDAVILSIAYTFGKLKACYSYDITVSRLLTNSAGSHEVSLVYVTKSKSKPKHKVIPCPAEQLDIYK